MDAEFVERDHYREIHHTSESPELEELQQLEELKKALGELVVDEGLCSGSQVVQAWPT